METKNNGVYVIYDNAYQSGEKLECVVLTNGKTEKEMLDLVDQIKKDYYVMDENTWANTNLSEYLRICLAKSGCTILPIVGEYDLDYIEEVE